MRIWLLIEGEPLPIDEKNVRLLRIGMLAYELLKKGHQVIWWSSSFDHSKKEFRATCDKDVIVDSNYLIKLLHGSGYQKNISFQRIFHNRIIARKFLQAAQKEERPDIVLASLPTIELALAATQYGKQHNVPVVLDLPKILRPFARVALEWQFRAVKKACQNATGLIGITSEFLQWGLNYTKRDQKQFDAIYPLAYSDTRLDDKYIQEAELFWRGKGLKREDSNFIITFVGSINRSFQFDEIIDVAKKMAGDVELVIAGLGSELEKYRQQIRGCTNITFPGWLDRPKIYSLLKMSAVCIAPYIEREDFLMSIPNKIAEYLCAGVPVLTSLLGIPGALLEKNRCGFIYRDSDELIVILDMLKKDRLLREEMSKNARALYEREFVAEKIYANMCDHLEKIANSHKG